MEHIIGVLVETNIATIIAVSGIALLFLSFAGKFGTYIEIKAERQNKALITGIFLLILGVGMHAYPLLFDDGTGNGGNGQAIADTTDPTTTGSTGTHTGSETETERRVFIQAGSFIFEDSAHDVRNELVQRDIVAFVAPSDTFEFLCPGYYVVLISATDDQSEMRELLGRVREVAPDAFPRLRTHIPVDLSACPS
ncbi:MAG: hypothetical protein AAF739_14985 [Pseudomonadota bacterium]